MSDGVRSLLEDVAGDFVVSGEELERTIRRAERRQGRQRLVAIVTAFAVAAAGITAAVWAFSWGEREHLTVPPRPGSPPSFLATCVNGWEWLDTPSPGNFGATLRPITALSATDVWAVGSYGMVPASWSPPVGSGPIPPVTWTPLAEHWDGTRWSVVPAQNPGLTPGAHLGGTKFVDVAASSATDVWAVGGSATSTSGVSEHWDGTRWNVVASPRVNLVDGS
jgi:hypothetical protein